MEHNFVRESARYLRIDPIPGQQQESLKIYKLGGRPELQQLSQRLEDETPTTIHNRLQLARAGKYLNTLGKGARR